MTTALIIGSGPAAAGVALALSTRPDIIMTVLDIGLRLEPERQTSVDRLSVTSPSDWDRDALDLVSGQPVASAGTGLPQKRSYGSDFPFRDIGQLDAVMPADDVNRSLISAAYGGFSNVWGSQIMPLTPAAFNAWPVDMSEMEPHYRAILRQIPFSGEMDDLARLFPLMGSPTPLPEVTTRTKRVLRAYARHRRALNGLGITMGKARLSFKGAECVRCGRCMTGCPYSLIYSAAQSFDVLRQSERVTYLGGLLALEVSEDGDKGVVIAKELASGELHRFEADRVYVACGAVGTTRLVVNSLQLFDRELALAESQQFTLPMLSIRATPDPRTEPQFTLNQFNMTVALDEAGLDLAQLHFYTYNPAFVDALPRSLRMSMARPITAQLLRRLSVAIGYLPSWHSSPLQIRVRQAKQRDLLPELHISRQDPDWKRNPMLRTVLLRVLRSAPRLDLYPVLPKLMLAAGGKSYHLGGSFPHARHARTIFSSDRLGRVGDWSRIHLVDSSVFSTVPATTHTLTIMANAHRIASESLEGPP